MKGDSPILFYGKSRAASDFEFSTTPIFSPFPFGSMSIMTLGYVNRAEPMRFTTAERGKEGEAFGRRRRFGRHRTSSERGGGGGGVFEQR